MAGLSAPNEREGLRAYRQSKPHVSIIDINLPELSGYELLRKIRKEDPDAKVIMFSVNDDPAFVVRAVELGAKGFVSQRDWLTDKDRSDDAAPARHRDASSQHQRGGGRHCPGIGRPAVHVPAVTTVAIAFWLQLR